MFVVAIAVAVIVSWLFTFHLQHELPGEKPIASVDDVYRKCKQGPSNGAGRGALPIGYIRRIGCVYNRQVYDDYRNFLVISLSFGRCHWIRGQSADGKATLEFSANQTHLYANSSQGGSFS